MIKAFLFDLDGVITDTSEFHFLAWQRLGEDLGIPFSREDNEALRGVSRRESLRLLLKGREVTEEQAQSYMERKNNHYLELVHQMGPQNLLPGAREMLEETRELGLKRAIVSVSKNAQLVIEKLGIGGLIDGLIDGHAPARSKPFPDLFLLGAQLFGLEPYECLVIEDAMAGIQAAHAAGMQAVGLGPLERVGEAELVLTSLEAQFARDILERLKEL
jgi:beta-phosphoglucomutase